MSQAKREMFNEMDRLEMKKIRKEELMARVRHMEGVVRMYQELERAFGYCHPDLQVARLTKTEAIKEHERMERVRREETLARYAVEIEIDQKVQKVQNP